MTTYALDVADNFEVWAQQLGGRPYRIGSHHTRADLTQFSRASAVRIFGERRCAPLISRAATAGLPVHVGAPCADYALRLLDTRLNIALGESPQPRSVGGWHRLTDEELATYNLCSVIDSGAGRDGIRRALLDHPAWPYLNFIDTIDQDAVAQWLALVIDPRFHIAPKRPESVNRLCRYLQVVPATARVSLADSETHPFCQAVQRYRLTVKCWADWNNPPQQPLGPRQFLWRVFTATFVRKPPDVAAVRATQVFVRYARAVWLHVLAGAAAGRDGFFHPGEFFKQPDEVEAFRAYEAGFIP
ncbi:MAG: hypothetical protein E6Q97_29780 [Desulfurellales bacterium]|nr:MAG: hypothetical protein E6Q97_29780 [Desulfurellales bacterium]